MDLFLKMSEICVVAEPSELKTVVGSCIALCLWDHTTKIGGMAHIVLPERNGDKIAPEGKYADTAVAFLVAKMVAEGADHKNIVAASVGGASMFYNARIKTSTIGEKNAGAVRKHLERLRIPIITEEVGGFIGRKVAFYCSNGKLEITALNQKGSFFNLNN